MKKMNFLLVVFSALVCLSGCYTTGGFRGGVGYNRYETLQPIVINGVTYYPAVSGTVYDSRYYGTYYNGSMYYSYQEPIRTLPYHPIEGNIVRDSRYTHTNTPYIYDPPKNNEKKQNSRSSGSTRTTKKENSKKTNR